MFLLAPLGLIALRRREGRQLWLAALVFGANYFSNISARFLIPPLPFVALAMMLALSSVPHLAVAVAVLSAVLSWPAIVPRYAHPDAWRLAAIPWREALRITAGRPLPGAAPHALPVGPADRAKHRAGSTVFTFMPIPEAYTSRHIRVEYQSAANQIAGKILWTAVAPEYAPTWRLRFRFPLQSLRALRVVQTNRRRGYLEHSRIPHLSGRYRIRALAELAADGPTVPVDHTGCLRQFARHLLAVRRDS